MKRPELHPPTSDAETIRRALAGERRAEAVLAHHLLSVPRVLAAMNGRMGRPLSDHDLADVAQDTVVILLRKLREGAAIDAIQGWIYRACSFEFMNAVRRKRKRPRLSLEDLRSDEAPTRRPEPRGWDFEDVSRGLEILDKDEAIVIELKFFGGSTFDEIAARLDISQGTIKTQYYRGLVKLHEFLRTRYGEEEARARTPVG